MTLSVQGIEKMYHLAVNRFGESKDKVEEIIFRDYSDSIFRYTVIIVSLFAVSELLTFSALVFNYTPFLANEFAGEAGILQLFTRVLTLVLNENLAVRSLGIAYLLFICAIISIVIVYLTICGIKDLQKIFQGEDTSFRDQQLHSASDEVIAENLEENGEIQQE